ncbi:MULTISPECIES: NAD(P)H-binding protein [unclassified Pseudofrankia]|uniref:NAD(P)H-binding protein n=1 Tax=unclassified Pseudofrankia TaxID=2994372 RepID=UPI0008DAFA09|nr:MULTISPECIES: NAD(P)H-binding protein [unclassified Pseudofrankia]MDT3443971.1 NAD(P)H-binding protein [Pseudofrankia sp. BMG5.37]OHV44378.1 epimerase [Pseudofrankia sp. BMG5.36]
MRLLVTGGSGFLGRRVVATAVARGDKVIGLARSAAAAATLAELGASAVRADLDDAAGTRAAFASAGADALLNLASLGFGHAGTIVDAAGAAGLRRAVFVSTTAVTTTLNAPSKRVRLAAEETIRASGLDWTIIRPTMIYGGPDDRNMCRLLALLRRSPVMPLPGDGRGLHQPVHVEDLADVLLRAVESDIAVGRRYDVAGPRALPLREIVDESAAALGRRVTCVPVPLGPTIRLAELVGRLAGPSRGSARGTTWNSSPRLAPSPRGGRRWISAEQIARLAEDKAFSIEAAAADLRFAPRSFADGIRAQAGHR